MKHTRKQLSLLLYHVHITQANMEKASIGHFSELAKLVSLILNVAASPSEFKRGTS